MLLLGAKASKRLPLDLVRTASGNEEIGATEPINELTRPLNLDEGGLFLDLVAQEVEETEEDLLPLLNAKGAGGNET